MAEEKRFSCWRCGSTSCFRCRLDAVRNCPFASSGQRTAISAEFVLCEDCFGEMLVQVGRFKQRFIRRQDIEAHTETKT